MFEQDGSQEVGTQRAAPLAELTRAQQLEVLRARIAAIPGRIGTRTATPSAPASHREAHAEPPEILPLPGALGEILPGGGLPCGSVVSCRGGGALLLGVLAAATQTGAHAALVGNPRAGLLAYSEMDGDLARLAHIPDPGPDPLAVVSILVDGVSVVVLDIPGSAPPSRVRAITARVRQHGAVLIITDPGWARPHLELHTRVAGYTGLGPGRGRLREIHLDIEIRGRALRPRIHHLVLAGGPGDRATWTHRTTAATVTVLPRTQTG
ncbi:hypothetical protein [Nocardia sp. NPDC050710]|uniref:hypothetical protein n=1 Tax=Nocardia sp. NPDC050710 TaxID=3157220 RepID=UPI0033F45D91